MSASHGPQTVLGIDTSLRCSGLGVLRGTSRQVEVLDFGLIKNPARWKASRCLGQIHAVVHEKVREFQPDAVAIEGMFHCKNMKIALALGQARGAAMAACAQLEIPVFEYSPRSVKKAVVGVGAAQKGQVGLMIRAMLKMTETPPEDAADALAIALCHLNQQTAAAFMPSQEV